MIATLTFLCMALQTPSPPMMFAGDSAKILTPRRVSIKNDVDWLSLWSENTGQSWSLRDGRTGVDAHVSIGAPMIDFSRYQAVAVFAGPKIGIAGITVTKVEEDEKRVTLVLESIRGRSNTREYHPYGIFVIPKTTKEVAVREVISTTSPSLLSAFK